MALLQKNVGWELETYETQANSSNFNLFFILPAELSFARFWSTQERLCMNRVRSSLSMRVLLGCSFESRLKSRALSTAGSIMTIGLSKNRCSH